MADLFTSHALVILLFLFSKSTSYGASHPTCEPLYPPHGVPIAKQDVDLMQFPQNLEFLEAEFMLWASFGYGLDQVAPWFVMGGPPPIGVRKANLDHLTQSIVEEFALQEIGHLRALFTTVGGIPRPLMDLSSQTFAKLMEAAFGYKLDPPFDPYINSLNFMIALYVIPYVGLVGYTGTNPLIEGYETKRVRQYRLSNFAKDFEKLSNHVAV